MNNINIAFSIKMFNSFIIIYSVEMTMLSSLK